MDISSSLLGLELYGRDLLIAPISFFAGTSDNRPSDLSGYAVFWSHASKICIGSRMQDAAVHKTVLQVAYKKYQGLYLLPNRMFKSFSVSLLTTVFTVAMKPWLPKETASSSYGISLRLSHPIFCGWGRFQSRYIFISCQSPFWRILGARPVVHFPFLQSHYWPLGLPKWLRRFHSIQGCPVYRL